MTDTCNLWLHKTQTLLNQTTGLKRELAESNTNSEFAQKQAKLELERTSAMEKTSNHTQERPDETGAADR